jgi:hypothetical protein
LARSSCWTKRGGGCPRAAQEATTASRARFYATVGIVLNLGAIGWFKYANFLAETAEPLTGIRLALPPIALPLAISFPSRRISRGSPRRTPATSRGPWLCRSSRPSLVFGTSTTATSTSHSATAFVDADHLTATSAEIFAPVAIRACFGEDQH